MQRRACQCSSDESFRLEAKESGILQSHLSGRPGRCAAGCSVEAARLSSGRRRLWHGRCGESVVDGKMGQFQKRISKIIPGVTRMRACVGSPFLPPAGINLASKQGGEAPPSTIAPSQIVAFEVYTPQGFADSVALAGPHRCQTAKIVVVSDLAVLHDEAKIAASADLVVAFVYLVLCGLDVVTLHQWQNALEIGNTRRMNRLHHREVRLQPLASVSFGEQLQVESPDVRRFSSEPQGWQVSQFEVVSDSDGDIRF